MMMVRMMVVWVLHCHEWLIMILKRADKSGQVQVSNTIQLTSESIALIKEISTEISTVKNKTKKMCLCGV